MSVTSTTAARTARKLGLGLVSGLMLAGAAQAQNVPVEQALLGNKRVSVHVHPFLGAEEMQALRFVMASEDALALFVAPEGKLAVAAAAPADGFIRGGTAPASVMILGEKVLGPNGGSIADLRTAAVSACNQKKSGGPDCVVVLEIEPAN